jgi:hypothetical protein
LCTTCPLSPRERAGGEGSLRLEQFEIKVNNQFWDKLRAAIEAVSTAVEP